MAAPDARFISRGLRAQSITSMALASVLLLVGPVAAYSSLFGSLAAFIPALFFAFLVTPKIGMDSVNFLRTAMLAEAGKLILTAALCVAVFVGIEPLAALWFFVGMLAAIFSGWLGMALRA